MLQNIFFVFNLQKTFLSSFGRFSWVLVFVRFGRVGPFEQVSSDLKGFRTILLKKLFRLKMFTLLETRITSKRFSVLFAFFEVFDRFSVLCYLAVLVMSAIFK